jgi:hypothetical protein
MEAGSTPDIFVNFYETILTDTNEGGWRREREMYTNGVCCTPEVTEYFIHQLSEADWFTRSRDGRCAEASKTRPPFVSVTLQGNIPRRQPCSYSPPWEPEILHDNNIKRTIEIVKLIIMRFSPSSCPFLSCRYRQGRPCWWASRAVTQSTELKGVSNWLRYFVKS